jgi:Protein of unknown function (DUF3575)
MASLTAVLLAAAALAEVEVAPDPPAAPLAQAQEAKAAPTAPRHTVDLELGPLVLESSIFLLLEVQVMKALSLYFGPHLIFETHLGRWRRWSGVGGELGVRVFPLSREAPKGWHVSAHLSVDAWSIAAMTESGDPATQGTYGVQVTAGLVTGYRWLLWHRLALNPYLGVRRLLIDLFPAQAGAASSLPQTQQWSLELGLTIGVAF